MRQHYKENDVLLKTDYDNLLDEISTKWEEKATLKPGEPVYFDKNVQISRNEFKKQFPTNKVVKNANKARYYIGNSKPYFWVSFYQNGSNQSRIILNNNLNGYRDNYLDIIRELNEAIDFVNGEAKVVNPASITFKTEHGELPDDMMERLTTMLKSSDIDTFNLGWKLLFEYDHIVSKDKFLLIIAQANSRTFWSRTKGRVIEQKFKQFKTFYPLLRF
jgi:hypothetical protein